MRRQAFSPEKYDTEIVAALPYYEEYFKQIADLVRTPFCVTVIWLDIGCGTGKMADMAIRELPVKKMVCCDNSPQMLKIAEKQIRSPEVDFWKTPIQSLQCDSELLQ